LAAERGLAVAEPFDDPLVLAGAGTVGLEIVDQWPDVQVVLCPVSGGGLLGGVATAVKAVRPDIAVWGVEPSISGGKARRSLAAGELVEVSAEQAAATIADGLRVRRLGAVNWAAIEAHVDGVVAVSEDEIVATVGTLAHGARLVAEPSGAVATAGWLHHRDELPAGLTRAVAVVSGGNVDPAWFATALSSSPR
jgi:threonine dehydratase